jgi:hypothetical protein
MSFLYNGISDVKGFCPVKHFIAGFGASSIDFGYHVCYFDKSYYYDPDFSGKKD